MRLALLILVLMVIVPLTVFGQARTADRLQPATISTIDNGNPPVGSVRWVINARRQNGPCVAASVGETPVGADAVKTPEGWLCSSRAGGAGTGDVAGPSASVAGEVVLFSTTNGKGIGRSNTLSGIGFLTGGVLSTLASSGTGDVARVTGPALTGVNASTIFSSGTIPIARVISGTIVNQRCLRTSNTGQIEVAAFDCGTGGGGSPGGVSGNLTYNESGAFGGLSNTAYDLASGRLTFTQKANSNDTLVLQRFTDSSPTGTLLRARNAANSTDLWSINADGGIYTGSTITVKTIAAPATPASGNTIVWTDSTGKNLRAKDDAGNISGTVRAITCSGTDKLSAISSAGVPTCTADQTTPGGTGITSLNALTAADQTFVNDTNITVVSSGTTHTITWAGTLAKARQHAATAYTDAANTWTTGAQSFAAATSLTVPSAAGAAPTASAQIAYDSTSNTWEAGVNGTNRLFAFTAGAQTFSDKTLDNSTTANLRDTLFTLQDNADATKTVNFELSGIATATNRVVTIADAASVTVQPTTATANQWLTHIDSAGVQQKAQPAFSSLSGSLGVTQGGTGQTAVAQGDLLVGDATNSWTRLAKSASATRYLSNTGASNNPAWAQVDLTNGVTGLLPPANWSPLTTKGDLVVHNGSTTTRLAVGTNGFGLIADSTQTAGVRWGAITATAGGSSTQLQYNSSGSLTGISGATSDGTSVTFSPANLIVGGQSAAPTPVAGAFYRDTDDNKLYWAWDGSNWGEVFVSGLTTVNLASANVTGTLPLANGGTNQTSWTAARCVRVNAGGTALEAAAADCGATPGGSGSELQFRGGASTFSAVTGSSVSGGTVVLGHTATLGRNGQSLEITTSANYGGVAFNTFSTDASESPLLDFNRSKSATKGTQTVVANNDTLGIIGFRGSDGTAFQDAAAILGQVDGTPGASDMPGRLIFRTTSDGSATPTERWRMTSAGHLLAGADNTYDIGATAATRPRTGYFGTSVVVGGTSIGAVEFKNATSGTITLSPTTGALGTVTLTLPARTATVATTTGTLTSGRCVEIDASGNFIQSAAACGGGGGGGADTALSNLASVAINTTLVSDTDNTDDLGTSSIAWRNAYIGTGIELGHASDTTLTRSAAGVVAVEGVAVTRTIASGTASLGTSAIASGTCASAVTVTATGTATTDVVGWGFNGDPTGVTGYIPSANGMLTIIAYPSANNVNFKVCNNLAASVTPGAITLNFRVTR